MCPGAVHATGGVKGHRGQGLELETLVPGSETGTKCRWEGSKRLEALGGGGPEGRGPLLSAPPAGLLESLQLVGGKRAVPRSGAPCRSLCLIAPCVPQPQACVREAGRGVSTPRVQIARAACGTAAGVLRASLRSARALGHRSQQRSSKQRAKGRRGADAPPEKLGLDWPLGWPGSPSPRFLAPSGPPPSSKSSQDSREHPPSSRPGGAARRQLPLGVRGVCKGGFGGPGAVLGADPEAGLSLRQGPAPLPPTPVSLSVSPPSSCSGRSPAWGGRRPAGQVR